MVRHPSIGRAEETAEETARALLVSNIGVVPNRAVSDSFLFQPYPLGHQAHTISRLLVLFQTVLSKQCCPKQGCFLVFQQNTNPLQTIRTFSLYQAFACEPSATDTYVKAFEASWASMVWVPLVMWLRFGGLLLGEDDL